MRYFLMIFLWCYGICAAPQHGVSIYGDLKYPKDFKHFSYNNPHAPKGGKFRYAAMGSFDSLNPFIIKGNPAMGMFLTYATLMAQSNDEPSSAYGYVAKTIDVDEKSKTVTFQLNKVAKFSDGKPITSSDVKFTFDALRKSGSPLYASYYKDVETCLNPNAHTVVFKIKKWSREVPFILGQIPVLPKHFYKIHDFSKSSLKSPPTSGPYTVGDVDVGKRIIYKRVPSWWGADIPSQRGTYNFETIEFVYFRDDTAKFEAFKRGDIDFRHENSAKSWDTGYDFPAIKRGDVQKRVYVTEQPKPTYGIFMNMRRPELQNRDVRRALTIAFDFEWLNKNVFSGIYKRNKSMFPVSPFAANAPANDAETKLLKSVGVNDGDIINYVFDVPTQPDQMATRAVLHEALKLLKCGGFELKNQKMVNIKTGKPLVLEFLCNNPRVEKIALGLQNNLKRLGIALKVRLMDTSSYEERVSNFDYDMILEVIPQSSTPGNEQRDFFGAAAAHRNGSRNYSGIGDKSIDALIETIIDAKTYPDLITATKAMDRLLLWHHIMIPAWHFDGFMMAFWNRFGGVDSNPSQMTGIHPLVSWWSLAAPGAHSPAHHQEAFDLPSCAP